MGEKGGGRGDLAETSSERGGFDGDSEFLVVGHGGHGSAGRGD